MSTATSCMDFVRSMQTQYRAMANASEFEAVLDRKRRDRGGRPTELTQAKVERVFDLYYGQQLAQWKVAALMKMPTVTVWSILHRKLKVSANQPKHKNET